MQSDDPTPRPADSSLRRAPRHPTRPRIPATNPANAAEGTIRKLYAVNVGENSVHGSDSPENAKIEIVQFFKDDEIVG